jgi:hypothetical protein
MSDSRIRHSEDLMSLWDVIGAIAGGASIMALPFLVAVPGLIALLGLCVALVIPLLALGLAAGIVGAPFVGIWWLTRRTR